ncbi:MAG: pyruvate kinase, partial [Flavobacteriaceae bacterium]
MTIRKKTKIIATLGPASDKEEIIEEMILSGVDVFRINFSHAEHEDVKKRIQSIRKISKKLNSNTSILADLQGPKLRIGKVEADTTVAPGDQIAFLNGDPFEGNKEKVFMNYENFSRDVKPGERILLDDGKLIFEVIATDKQSIVDAKVIQGGKLKSKKGVNLPNTKISLPALTKKDIVDAEFAIGEEVDWIALSFVRNSEDILDLRKMIEKQSDHKIPIIAKIEKPEGIENIDKIISYCDGLMVARGDLGVEIPPAEVPLVQKELVKLAKKARIPVIIATQMMESMIDSLT